MIAALTVFIVVVLVLVFSTVIGAFVGTWLEDNSECDDLPMQHPRSLPEPPRVRLCPFDQDASA